VIFTLDPTTDNRVHIVIEAAWGLGELVVQGDVRPDRYVVDETGLRILERIINHKYAMLTRSAAGDNQQIKLDEAKATAMVLSDDEVRPRCIQTMRRCWCAGGSTRSRLPQKWWSKRGTISPRPNSAWCSKRLGVRPAVPRREHSPLFTILNHHWPKYAPRRVASQPMPLRGRNYRTTAGWPTRLPRHEK
jgi:pyruvate phosphate dikinase-like enzyme